MYRAPCGRARMRDAPGETRHAGDLSANERLRTTASGRARCACHNAAQNTTRPHPACAGRSVVVGASAQYLETHALKGEVMSLATKSNTSVSAEASGV